MAKKSGSGPATEEQGELTFESALSRLETVVAELENGRLGLSEALASYEQGVNFLRRCYELLEKAEKKVALLSGTDESGRPIVVPLDDATDASLEEKAAARSRRRSSDGALGAKRTNKEGNDGVDGPGDLF